MAFFRELYLRLRWLIGRSRFHSELADEMRFHIESRAEELEQSGVPRSEALLQARREFGSRMKAAENTSGAWQTVRWAGGSVLRSALCGSQFPPQSGFRLTAIFCLALGIGANATVFNNCHQFPVQRTFVPRQRIASCDIQSGNSAAPVNRLQVLRAAHIFDRYAASMSNAR